MAEEIISGVYKIENINTKKVYIGSSKDIYKRWTQHKIMLEKGNHHSIILQSSYNKTKDKTIFQYSIVEIINNLSQLKGREQYWIDFYDSFNNGYNCSLVDNPRYTNKIIKTRKKKEKVNTLYNDFWKLYDEEYCKIGELMLKRLKNNYYSVPTLNQLIFGLEWFIKNYNTSQYYLTFDYNKFTKKIPMITVKKIDNNTTVDWYYIVNQSLTKEFIK